MTPPDPQRSEIQKWTIFHQLIKYPLSPSLCHDFERLLWFLDVIARCRREPRRRHQTPDWRKCMEEQERSVDRFVRRGGVSQGKHRYRQGRVAPNDIVFLDRFHVRYTFFLLEIKRPFESQRNPGTSSHSPRYSSGVPSRPETLRRYAQTYNFSLRVLSLMLLFFSGSHSSLWPLLDYGKPRVTRVSVWETSKRYVLC